MINNSYCSQDLHGPYELHDIDNLELEEGGTIRGCKLAYATFGTLNAAKDNAVLIPTWYSSTNKIIEQVFIGEGRALDPDKYFIIIVNQLSDRCEVWRYSRCLSVLRHPSGPSSDLLT